MNSSKSRIEALEVSGQKDRKEGQMFKKRILQDPRTVFHISKDLRQQRTTEKNTHLQAYARTTFGKKTQWRWKVLRMNKKTRCQEKIDSEEGSAGDMDNKMKIVFEVLGCYSAMARRGRSGREIALGLRERSQEHYFNNNPNELQWFFERHCFQSFNRRCCSSKKSEDGHQKKPEKVLQWQWFREWDYYNRRFTLDEVNKKSFSLNMMTVIQ